MSLHRLVLMTNHLPASQPNLTAQVFATHTRLPLPILVGVVVSKITGRFRAVSGSHTHLEFPDACRDGSRSIRVCLWV